jgi:hypothetical protein
MGCSPKKDIAVSQSPPTAAADLGKSAEYFKKLYGAPKKESRMAEFAFALPEHGSIRLSRAFVVQDYVSERLRVKVVYPDSTRPAIWVKYTLPGPWTQEQIRAALEVYGAKWQVVTENLGMNPLPSHSGGKTGLTCEIS